MKARSMRFAGRLTQFHQDAVSCLRMHECNRHPVSALTRGLINEFHTLGLQFFHSCMDIFNLERYMMNAFAVLFQILVYGRRP